MDKDSGDSQGQGAANAVHENNKHFIFNPRHLEGLFSCNRVRLRDTQKNAAKMKETERMALCFTEVSEHSTAH